jgi:hypothetical protein
MNINKKITLLFNTKKEPSADPILSISGLDALFVAQNVSDFVLSGNDILVWKDKTLNHNDITFSGVLRVFDKLNKTINIPSTNNDSSFTVPLSYTDDYSVIIYELFNYKNSASHFTYSASGYIGENNASSYMILNTGFTNTFDKTSYPLTIRKHFIRKLSGSLSWVRNGIQLTRLSNNSRPISFSSLGLSGSITTGNVYAYAFFNRYISDEECDVVKNNLDLLLNL